MGWVLEMRCFLLSCDLPPHEFFDFHGSFLYFGLNLDVGGISHQCAPIHVSALNLLQVNGQVCGLLGGPRSGMEEFWVFVFSKASVVRMLHAARGRVLT
jgi:hypothetical protein